MQDSNIIWNFIAREYGDDHPIIYLYACGNVRSPKTATDKAMDLLRKIFYPAMSEHLIKTVLIAYLDFKKKQYLNGEIKIKSIY